jgi:hypothetical protein
MLLMLLLNTVRFLFLCLRLTPALAAENLFLRKQLALYQERHLKLRRATNTTRIAWSGSPAGLICGRPWSSSNQ